MSNTTPTPTTPTRGVAEGQGGLGNFQEAARGELGAAEVAAAATAVTTTLSPSAIGHALPRYLTAEAPSASEEVRLADVQEESQEVGGGDSDEECDIAVDLNRELATTAADRHEHLEDSLAVEDSLENSFALRETT